jgi:hypothetical protein
MIANSVFRCPPTDLNVQHQLDDDPNIFTNEYEAITCLAFTAERIAVDDLDAGRRRPYCASARSPLAKACQGCDELIGKLSSLTSSSAVPPIA